MTKIQRMEARIKEDEKIFLQINEVLDELDRKERCYPESIGFIRAILEIAGRRTNEEGKPVDFFTDSHRDNFDSLTA